MLGVSHTRTAASHAHRKAKTTSLYGAALFLLGNQRLLVQKDIHSAFVYILRSSLTGFVPATAVLAFLFEFGLARIAPDYPTNYQVAEKLYTNAAAQESGLAQARLAFLKTHGRPQIQIDQSLAEAYRRACGKQGLLSVAWLSNAAEAGLAPAQFCLALCYYNGIAVLEDDTSAFRWCERAAAQGHAGAQNVLGNLYVEGAGCEVNPTIGLRWYIKAAEQREAAAIYNIGTLYERGLALEEDPNQAFQWYVRAAMFGSINAQNVLGIFYEQGIGIAQNPNMAVYNYSNAAKAGHPHAQYNLGRCHHDGFGADRNDHVAAQWFDLAAQQNHALSQLSMGVCCEFGIGVPIDRQLAMSYYKRAASNDCYEAKRRLQPVVACQILVPARILLAGRMRQATTCSTPCRLSTDDDVHIMTASKNGTITPPQELPSMWSLAISSPSHASLRGSTAFTPFPSDDDEMDGDSLCLTAGPTPPPTPNRSRRSSPIVVSNKTSLETTPHHRSLASSGPVSFMSTPSSLTSATPYISNNNNSSSSSSIRSSLRPQLAQAGLHSLPVELLEYILSFLDSQQILTPQQRRLCCSAAGDRRNLSGPDMELEGESGGALSKLSKDSFLAKVGCPRFSSQCDCGAICGQIKHVIAQFESMVG
ncbi:hypothetical protein SeMB42_g00752 [Synchytrium endobioticum]|uniref:F-box domain-containing protein n=1 Tax=Synchytrium endobioticum TaxID=286115 RepID=A0A507DPA0_9FUNG|nr:hypothetical protein SeLEV6574_g03386 [Synchytrium endobioticum]TPX53502.1 hypothetical protein SeMB42_g00752 [Synchytrium endobioticum]